MASAKQAQSPAWLAPARISTTLFLTQEGLSLATTTAGIKPDHLRAITTASFLSPQRSAGAASARTASAALPPLAAQDGITTASVPASTHSAASPAVRQGLPLFGGYRIRFGKIGSGARIAGLIRKAAATDSSAICIHQCASLADNLTLKGASLDRQLSHVSRSVNQMIAYRTDEESHARLDQWSTPNETLRSSSGDCEDYAILKMALLSRLGIPMNAMEIVVVKDTSRRLFHAVLSVTMDGRSLILDNMTDAVETDQAKKSYAPLFSISGTANYVFGYKGGKSNLMASIKDIASVAPGAGF